MMFAKCARGIGLSALLVLNGCASDTAIFVTKSSLSIFDVDTTPPEISLAYHRIEGFIAPRNKNGDSPRVLANLKSDGTLLTPMIQQVYATGSAAETLTGHPTPNNSTCTTCTDATASAPVFFTTSTSLGLKFSFSSNNVVDGLVLGFRRKEISVVPSLAKDADGTYHYPSLIATLRAGVPGQVNTGDFAICQGFATGTAATALAGKIAQGDGDTLGCTGTSIRANLLGEYRGSLEKQNSEVAEILSCYVGVPQAAKSGVWTDAQRLGLFASANTGNQTQMISDSNKTLKVILGWAASGNDPNRTDAQRVADRMRADRVYADGLMIHATGAKAGDTFRGSTLREQLLRSHRESVCTVQR